MDERIDRVAREAFGFAALRPGQGEAIESVLAGRDTLVVMSTGSGKSADLPDRRPADRRRDRGRLAPDRAPARPGRGLDGADVGRRRAAQLEPARRRARARARGAGRRTSSSSSSSLPSSSPTTRCWPSSRSRAPSLFVVDEAHCISRVGPRLPPRVPAARRGDRGARAPDDPRPHRHRGAAGARRDRRAARACATRRCWCAASTGPTSAWRSSASTASSRRSASCGRCWRPWSTAPKPGIVYVATRRQAPRRSPRRCAGAR